MHVAYGRTSLTAVDIASNKLQHTQMGKKVFNAKARKNPEAIVDRSAIKDVKIELAESGGDAGYDESNALVLPSKKIKAKLKVEKQQNVKILTKKQRKHLQTIVDKKKKKEARAGLLEALANVQIPEQELQQYTSISQVQTVGVKKLPKIDELLLKKKTKKDSTISATTSFRCSSIKGAGKRKLLAEEETEIAAKKNNPNYVGLDPESDTDTDTESEDDHCEDMEIAKTEPEKLTQLKDEVQPMDTCSSNKENESKSSESTLEMGNKVKANATIVPSHATVFMPVIRDPGVQIARMKLPILAEEQQIMETINENSIIIIAGETGSGKTTQIPQFLYEAGYTRNNKMIGITEPRRVAAIAMSKRVAYEMNMQEREVSYLIRFEGNATPDTKIKFMTDGVLLKEIESDFLLLKYSVIILDEAHERSAYTDILVGLLSRIVPLRLKKGKPLKLIIMSATLRVEDFTGNKHLFQIPPPVINVEARQFPVTIHFQKTTPSNYVNEAFRKTLKIHAKLPEGGILIFVTGQLEVNNLVRKLRRAFPYVKGKEAKVSDKKELTPEKANEEKVKEKETQELAEDELEVEFDMKRAIRNVRKSKRQLLSQMILPKVNLDDYKLPTDDTEAELHEIDEDVDGSEDDDDLHSNEEIAEDDDDEDDEHENINATKQPLWVLPLYSLLSTEKQNRIFQAPPEGCRLCVVSTNVAETSLTIPNIKYVVDSGRQKTRLYDKITGVSSFVVTYTSKASADQRAGRAGRVSAGHCYRLYSSAVYNDEFVDFSVPDIQKKPVDDLMLQMRCMGIDRVINFPFPSPPDIVQLEAAERRLIVLGALEAVKTECANTSANSNRSKQLPPIVTKLGYAISRFPVAPRFGKMLALSHQQNLMPYTVCLVAALSVQEVLMEHTSSEQDDSMLLNRWQNKRKSWASTGHYQLLGDPMVLLRAVGGAEYAGSKGQLTEFCNNNGLRYKAITEIRKLRKQITNEINLHVEGAELCVDPEMSPPTDAQARFLRQILLAGMGDHVAHKVPLDDISDKEEKRRLKYAYNCADMEEPVFMHSSSVLTRKLPEWVIYQEAYEIVNGDTRKMFIRGITAIEPDWLLTYVPLLCNVRDIKEEPAPRYNARDGKVYCYVDATFGKAAWQLPLVEIEMPLNEKACCYLGMFILDGQVCPKLSQYKGKLKATPSSLLKSWSNLNESVLRFKRALISRRINTRHKLLEQWQQNPNFLLEEYCNMLYSISQAELSSCWPPLEEEAID